MIIVIVVQWYLPSGVIKHGWQWNMDHRNRLFSYYIKPSIYREFSTAMFDYQRVCFILARWDLWCTLWAQKLGPGLGAFWCIVLNHSIHSHIILYFVFIAAFSKMPKTKNWKSSNMMQDIITLPCWKYVSIFFEDLPSVTLWKFQIAIEHHHF